MKYRIVERKDDDGNSFFSIEFKRWLFWHGYSTTLTCGHSVSTRQMRFKTYEKAEDVLRRSLQKFSYKGICIYPTVRDDVFFVLEWSKKSKTDYYDEIIIGSYEECRQGIDHKLKAIEMKKFKKITNIAI